MSRFARSADFPEEMQGEWVVIDDPATTLKINGADVLFAGRAIEHDFKVIKRVDGALCASLCIEDPAQEDSFQRSNITELVITPTGEFFAYNLKFSSQFIRRIGVGPIC